MTRVELDHALGREEARRRLEQVAARHDVRLEPEGDGFAGTVVRSIGFLGTVRGRYEVDEGALRIEITEKPALLPAETLRRMLEEELAPALQPRAR